MNQMITTLFTFRQQGPLQERKGYRLFQINIGFSSGKHILLSLMGICISLMVNAQVLKSVELTPGSLSTVLTTIELGTVTNLTLTGTIDARDFKTMRDEMPLLKEIDLTGTTIVAYTGAEGTFSPGDFYYPVNEVPFDAFYNSNSVGKVSLTSVQLPESITSIGQFAFRGCLGLTSLVMPGGVTSIGNYAFGSCRQLTSFVLPEGIISIGVYAFQDCSSLTSITIPSSVTAIGDGAFTLFSGMIAVDSNNHHYSSIDGVLFNKDQTALLQCPISKVGNYVIPVSVTSIGTSAFFACNSLTSVTIPASVGSIGKQAFARCAGISYLTIPASVIYIGPQAFWGCRGLTSITTQIADPLAFGSTFEVFGEIDKTTCYLIVPQGTATLYRNADQWKDFTTIVEISGFSLSSHAIALEAVEGSESTVKLFCDNNWTSSSDQSWLTISASEGIGNGTLTFTAQANSLDTARQAIVTVKPVDKDPQTIIVTQKAKVQNPMESGALTYGENWNDTIWNQYNLIKDWNFNHEQNWWNEWMDPDVAGQNAPVYENGIISITAKKSDNGSFRHYRFSQVWFKAVANVPYVLKFKSWSSVPKLNRVNFEENRTFDNNLLYGASTDPTATNGRSEWTYNTITEPRWFTFHVVFDQMAPTLSQQILWMLSNTDATTYLDSVILVRENDPSAENTEYMLFPASNVSMEDTESTLTFDLTSNTTWQLYCDQPWLTVSPLKGNGNQTITLTAKENPLHLNRIAYLGLYSASLPTQPIIVVQKAKPGVPIEPNDSTMIEYWSSEAWNNYNLIRNWDFTTDFTHWAGWIDPSVDGQIAPVITNGYVTMTTGFATDGTPWHYQHSQSGLEAEANVPYTLKFKSWSNIPRSNALKFEDAGNSYKRYGASTDVDAVDGRTEWNYYTTPEPRWYVFHMVFDQMIPTTQQEIQWALSNINATTFLDSVILIKDADLLLIKEAELALSSNQVSFGATEDNALVNVTSNTKSMAISNKSWLKVSPANVTGNQTLTFAIETNSSDSIRTATVTVYPAGLESKAITVTQGFTTGITSIKKNQDLTIYPNPTSGKIKLVLDQIPQNGTYLTVTDVTGRIILKQFIQNKEQWIDLSGNKPGVYLVKTNLKDVKVQKILLK